MATPASTKTEYHFTREEADKFIRNQPDRVTFFARLGAFLAVGDGSRGFEGSGCLEVNRKQARKAAESLLSETLQERGARITISWYPNGAFKPDSFYIHRGCLFIG